MSEFPSVMPPRANFESIEGTCIMCPRLASTVCPKCKDARYCGKDCQTLDWRNHKIISDSFDHTRPSTLHRRVLLFPDDNTPPRFEWVHAFPLAALGLPGSGEFLNTPKYFGTQDSETNSTAYNTLQGRIPTDDPAYPAPTNINHAFRASTRAGACGEDMKGPIITTRAAEFVLRQLTYRNMDMRDARNAVDWLSQGGRGDLESNHQRDVEVLGTTIESTGRVISQGAPQWSDVLVDGTDIIWTSEGSQIANLLGLPLLFRSTRYGKATLPNPDFENPATTLLHRDVVSTKVLAPSSLDGRWRRVTYYGDREREARRERSAFVGISGFGSSMSTYNGSAVETCYVVRADGKPLPKEHTEAICSYIVDKVEPQLAAAIDGLSVNDTVVQRSEILSSITKSSFLEYNEVLKQENVRHCNMAWRDLPNPYEIKRSDLDQRKEHIPRARVCVPPPIQRIGPVPEVGPLADPTPTFILT